LVQAETIWVRLDARDLAGLGERSIIFGNRAVRSDCLAKCPEEHPIFGVTYLYGFVVNIGIITDMYRVQKWT
jgi:hypothetical protein